MGGFNNGTPGQSGLRNTVRYDTPEFAGFAASASWGEDDQWETALKYKGEYRRLQAQRRLSATARARTRASTAGSAAQAHGDCQWWGAGALVSHTPTGLYLYGGYAENRIDLKPAAVALGKDDKGRTFYIQGGIERKWWDLGKTNVFVEYRRDDVGLTKAADSSDLDFWAAGVAQNIENADMTLYALYRHFDGDFSQGHRQERPRSLRHGHHRRQDQLLTALTAQRHEGVRKGPFIRFPIRTEVILRSRPDGRQLSMSHRTTIAVAMFDMRRDRHGGGKGQWLDPLSQPASNDAPPNVGENVKALRRQQALSLEISGSPFGRQPGHAGPDRDG